MALPIKIKRGTRAQLDTAAAANGLLESEPYLITDEGRIAVGLSVSTYETFSKEVFWVAAPADKIGTGYTGTAKAGQFARDANFIYICETGGTATNQAWTRIAKATNW